MKKIILTALLVSTVAATAFAAGAVEKEARRSGNAVFYPVNNIVITDTNGGALTCAWQETKAQKKSGWMCTQSGSGVDIKSVTLQGSNNAVTCSPTTLLGGKPSCQSTVVPSTPVAPESFDGKKPRA